MIELSETSKVFGKKNQIYRYLVNVAKCDEELATKLFTTIADYLLDKYGENGITMDNLCFIQPKTLCKVMNKDELLYHKTVEIIGYYKIILINEGSADIGFPMKKYEEAYTTYMRYATNQKHISKLKQQEKVIEDYIDICEYYENNDKYEKVHENNYNSIFIQSVINKKFGKLTPKVPYKRVDIGDQSIYWLCQCDCGNWRMVQKADLLHIKSCGCEKILEQNLIGKKYGTLTCIDHKTTITKSGAFTDKVKVKCDCGNIKLFNVARFMQGKTCGRWCKYTNRYSDNGKQFKRLFHNGTNISKLGTTDCNANSSTGYLGVTYNKQMNKYMAYITFQHKSEQLGFYNLPETAYKVRLTAQKLLQGECIAELEKDEFVQKNKYLMKILRRVKAKLNSIN